LSLLRLRYRPENVTGIDIRSDQVQSAAHFLPQARFVAGDASAMGFDDDTFDLVYESTMFATLPDDALSGAIAREMIRVCRPGGYLLLVDWWMPKIGDPEYKALTRGRLKSLFLNSNKVELLGIRRGAIVPPLGRLLSKWLPSLYFLTTAMVPLVVGQVTYVLRKN
jgi:ubiquinone/menaquinone biosynthesis C-methylase UbiE